MFGRAPIRFSRKSALDYLLFKCVTSYCFYIYIYIVWLASFACACLVWLQSTRALLPTLAALRIVFTLHNMARALAYGGAAAAAGFVSPWLAVLGAAMLSVWAITL